MFSRLSTSKLVQKYALRHVWVRRIQNAIEDVDPAEQDIKIGNFMGPPVVAPFFLYFPPMMIGSEDIFEHYKS